MHPESLHRIRTPLAAPRRARRRQAETTIEDTLNTLTDEYDVSRQQLECDVVDLLDKLADAGLVARRG